ncbi:MAG: hypothetical protein IKF72_13285 [Kiritimatiellae bacterium]|nr:hypothetical protein [Kiritimatiellia bacterium]
MNAIKIAAAVAAVSWSATSGAVTPVPVSPETGTGFWMENFADATNLANQAFAPMVLFWANEGCTYCGYLEDAVNSAQFKEWQGAHQNYIYCYVQARKGVDVAPNAGANVKQFASSAGGTLSSKNRLSEYPFVCLYWPQAPGVVKVVSFVGRTGKMLVPAVGRTLAQELEDSMEKQFVGYSPEASVTFRCGDDAGSLGLENRNDRLEAEPSTETVLVPLERSGSFARPMRNALVVEWPDGMKPTETNEIEWAVLQTNAYVAVDVHVPDGAGYPEGRRLELTLLDAEGMPVASNAITFVSSKPNSNTNPYWIGERTASTLGFAEWTHDYDAVRSKVASGGADYTLVLFSGTLWCPYCRGIDESLFQSEEFKAWCEARRVQVALFDQAQTAANGGGSQQLSYVKGVEHIANSDVVTGASYLSRHGLRDDDPRLLGIRERTVEYSTSRWLAPETTAARLSNPTVLLIDSNDNVVGRFSAWRDRSREFSHALGDKYYDPGENIARLDALLALAGRGDESQDYASTTTNMLEMGGSVVLTLQVNDPRDHFVLSPPSRGRAVFSVTGKTADRSVSLSILRDGGEIASSDTGELAVEFSREDISAKRLVLRVSAPGFSGASANARFGADNAFDVTLTSSFKPIAQGEATIYAAFPASAPLSSHEVSEGQKVKISVTSGKLPKGLSLAWDAKTASVVVKGTSTSTGTFSFKYKVTVTTSSGKTVSKKTTKATLAVLSAAAVNPYYGKSFVATVPLCKTDSWGVTTLSSAVQISQTTKLKLSAKRFTGATASFSGGWKKLDPESGLLTASLKSGNTALKVTLDANGRLAATVGSTTGAVSVANGYGRFAGSYTVTMPVLETTAWYYTFGAGFLTLKTSATTMRKGLVTYAGALPNGVAVSGSAYLGGDPDDSDYAYLTVFVRSSRKLNDGSRKYSAKDDLAAVLRIRADGAELYADAEQNRVILAPDGVNATWKRTTSADDNALVATMDVFGGYYEPGRSLDDWLLLFGLGTPKDIVATVDGIEVPAKWTFSTETGVLTGQAKTVIDRRTVTAKFKAVILPGWIDCGCGDELPVRPFATGTFYYSSRVSGFSTPSSLEFDLHAQ